ncbi:glycosyltransferase family 4 protein [bacterium]|nr:glycosyltransferase family 4 protein [bacterium]
MLLGSNRYFVSGGPERYLFNIGRELANLGHEVVPFSLAYPQNEPTPHARHFPPPPAEGFVRHGDRALTFAEKARLARSVVFDRAIYNRARRVLREERIDAVYALQIAHFLYPELLLAARDERRPVLWRQSDFQIVCPAYNAFRAGAPCTLCDRSLAPALRYRCLKGSFSVTATRVVAMTHARLRNVDGIPRRIVCPSRFLIRRLKEAGVSGDRLVHLPTPIPDDWLSPVAGRRESFALYAGGLFPPKGAHVAIEAARLGGFELVVAGDTETDDGRKLVASVPASDRARVTFLGHVNETALRDLYDRAGVVLVPSLWFENAPHVVLEAFARGAPVLASDIGSLPELVRPGATGFLCPPGDAGALAEGVRLLLDDPARAKRLGDGGRALVEAEHRMAPHAARLVTMMKEAIAEEAEVAVS